MEAPVAAGTAGRHAGLMFPARHPLSTGRAPSFQLGYRPALDGLRGIAVLTVMGHHSPLRLLAGGGFLGVDLFFVLSGFLITALLLEEHERSGTMHLGRFYLRRALRLLPALWMLLVFCCLLALGCRSSERAQAIYRPVLLTACHAANWSWYFGVPLRLLGHVWSLGVEEQFYLVWPIVLWGLLRLGADRRVLAVLLAVGIVAAAVLRVVVWQGPDTPSHEFATTCPATRADALLAGCLLAVCLCQRWSPQRLPGAMTILAVGFLVGCGLVAREGDAWLYRGGFTLVAVAAALVIASLLHSPPWLLCAPPLVWIGRISYGLYLWHFPLFGLMPGWVRKLPPGLQPGPVLSGTAQVGLTFAVAALSFYFVEQPIRHWGRRADKSIR